MSNVKALIEKLSLAFGPSGCEGEVADIIRHELTGLPVELTSDRMGNLIAHLKGPEGAPRVMLSAHMDEVGFMITEIEKEGFLRFSTLGGIDPRVLVGRAVQIGNEDKRALGVISAKGIHFQDREERQKLPKISEMYIDLGVASREEAQGLVALGDFGTFDTRFVEFGKDKAYFSGKALDDRVGCAILLEVLRAAVAQRPALDLWFAFTVREELGISGATVAANRIAPDIAIVLETTAIADLPSVDASRRVANVGKGGVLSLLDRGTIYDRDLIDATLATAKERGIPVQVKRYVSGGNDAKNIQRTRQGVRCLAFSLPTRYLHAPVSVGKYSDVTAMVDLLSAMLETM